MTDPHDAGFVAWFRASAPYIHAHRGRTFVILFSGELLRSAARADFVHDVALLQSLGVRVVLVAGARPQIDVALERRGRKPEYAAGLRITDRDALECVKEAGGTVQVELEALLTTGLPNSPMAGASVRVASGNFVMAQPVGVVDGIDYQYSGKVRRVDAEAIRQRLDAGAVVTMTSVGYSLTGEAFNVSTSAVASEVACAIGADKLIALTEGTLTDGSGEVIHELDPDEAERLGRAKRRRARDLKRQLLAAARAVRMGVPRAHLIPRRIDGGLLRELYTRDGVGTLVTATAFEGLRSARRTDIGGLLALIEPLEREGILVRRSRAMLENDVERFTIVERDGMVVACAALYPYPEEGAAELACVAVSEEYRGGGRADALLQYVERTCREQGISRLFVLTTQTAHWFVERGFEPGRRRDLPADKRRRVDSRRKSKVLVKALT